MSANFRRPAGVTLVALALFFFFVSAIGNLLVRRSIQDASFPAGSPGATFAAALNGPLCVSLIAFYAVTALVASIAAWRMHPWMPRAFLSWSVAALLLGAFFLTIIPTEILLGGKPAAAAFELGMAALLWLVYGYLRRAALAGANAAL
jgi:hypothetical protein